LLSLLLLLLLQPSHEISCGPPLRAQQAPQAALGSLRTPFFVFSISRPLHLTCFLFIQRTQPAIKSRQELLIRVSACALSHSDVEVRPVCSNSIPFFWEIWAACCSCHLWIAYGSAFERFFMESLGLLDLLCWVLKSQAQLLRLVWMSRDSVLGM